MTKKSKKTAVKKSAKPKAVSAKTKSKPVKATAKKTVGKTKTSLVPAKKLSAVSADPRVIEYKLFTEDSVRNLEDQVNYHIKKGWAPVGGVVLHGQSTFTQTMVRRED
ncbi:MAG: DUF1737 domain-containing protein [Oligoflexus sp.]|nr:DUF1737 domain-containing protein [Oligoflexus sp.]